jgi:hypothetical protein
MAYILFNEESQTVTDALHLLRYINDLTARLGIQDVRIDDWKCYEILIGMKHDFPHRDGIEAASPFKKVANFVSYFVAAQPIVDRFPQHIIGDELFQINNHQNAIVAALLAIDSLHNAVINRRDNVVCTLSNKIQLSQHSFVDLVDALSKATPVAHFKMLAVLFEQMAYKNNPDCQYEFLGW